MPGAAPQLGSDITLRLLVLKTTEPGRLREFYAVVGVPFAPERHSNGPLHYSGEVGGVVLELYHLEGEPGRSLLFYSTKVQRCLPPSCSAKAVSDVSVYSLGHEMRSGAR